MATGSAQIQAAPKIYFHGIAPAAITIAVSPRDIQRVFCTPKPTVKIGYALRFTKTDTRWFDVPFGAIQRKSTSKSIGVRNLGSRMMLDNRAYVLTMPPGNTWSKERSARLIKTKWTTSERTAVIWR